MIGSFLKQNKGKIKRIRRVTFLISSFVFIIWYINCLPAKLFNSPTSTVLFDKSGQLLGAKIANDGQWRFSPVDSIPKKFETCLLEFEDRNFYNHYGVSIKGIGRAIVQNFRNKKIVSGGSTITMQLARIMRKNPPRNVKEKIIEILIATRLEMRYSKKEILNYYSSYAPFGNNVVGVEAAAWRYYGRSASSLSWAESATLAVLPNAPGLIYPGKNHQRLLEKRNRLLKRLFDINKIDKPTYELSLNEPLPEKPLQLPQIATHLLVKCIKEGYAGKTINSTIDVNIQQKAMELLQSHSEILQENKIYNGAVMITSVKTGEIVAYVGNTSSANNEHSNKVDCIVAARSTGSILKPFLYAKSMEDGIITPAMLLSDVPTHYGSFTPKNFALQYDGAVPANQALARSLNIPMVRLLNDYGLEKFYYDLKGLGITTLSKPSRHYGLSLILGGAEAKLADLNQAYTQLAQQLELNKKSPVYYNKMEYEKKLKANEQNPYKTNTAVIYKTFDAMVEVNRPDEDGNWKAFASSQKIAWKTGTSFGFRDAWAIGVTTDYVVSVWIGNADGEGRPGLTGVKAAAPLMFSIFDYLPKAQRWFKEPIKEQAKVMICKESGCIASDICETKVSALVPKSCLNTVACTYHQVIHLSKDKKYRVDAECEQVYNMQHVNWFVLPPMIEKYYKLNHPNYKSLPDYKPECLSKIADKSISVIYPKNNSKIYVPIEIDGKVGRTVFEMAHRNSNTRIYWHLDDEYLGETKEIHQMALNPMIGKHKLMLIDENGVSVSLNFEVIGKE